MTVWLARLDRWVWLKHGQNVVHRGLLAREGDTLECQDSALGVSINPALVTHPRDRALGPHLRRRFVG